MANDKKKVLIWMSSMHPGGAERALIGLLHAFDYGKYDVDLFLNQHEGDFMEHIPSKVHLLPVNSCYACLAEPMKTTISKGHLLIAAGRLYGKHKAKRKSPAGYTGGGITGDYSHLYTKRFMPKIQQAIEYDLAISFITPHYFVAEKVRAKKKIAWIHTDYSQLQIDRDTQIKMWTPYDGIIAVSDSVAQSFCLVFPELKDKVTVIENILPEELIRDQAKEPIHDFGTAHDIRLLSIGRYSYPKNFESIPGMCRQLREDGFNVSWYIIGYGSGEQLIRSKIKTEGMEDHVFLLGKRSNPYPYIKACDVYVQPSRFEGKAVTVREAQVLAKPVVITNFPTAKSQLVEGVDGIIAPLDSEACADSIANLLSHPEIMMTLSEQCKQRDYSGQVEIEKVYKMMEG